MDRHLTPTAPPAAPPGLLRRAEVADTAAILRLREVMIRDLKGEREAERCWSPETVDWLRAALADPAFLAAFVIDEPGRGVVSVAVGRTVPWMPSPRNPAGLTGYVFNVATDADRRRRGHARRCLQALLDWFRTDTLAARVELNASADGLDLYRSLGFEVPTETSLRLSLDR